MRRILTVGVVVGAMITAPAPVDAMRRGGDVTIQTDIDLGSPRPVVGTFEVTEGAGVLGCSEGSLVDMQASYEKPNGPTAIFKQLSCGDADGTFTILFKPTPAPGPGNGNGHWTVTDATGVFSDLHGQGEMSVVVDFATGMAVETFSGHVDFNP